MLLGFAAAAPILLVSFYQYTAAKRALSRSVNQCNREGTQPLKTIVDPKTGIESPAKPGDTFTPTCEPAYLAETKGLSGIQLEIAKASNAADFWSGTQA